MRQKPITFAEDSRQQAVTQELQDAFHTQISFSSALGCAFLEVTGDGYCDDATNIPICEFDGGDCCLPNVHTDYCVECQCLDPDHEASAITSTASIACLSEHLIGDGYCDDVTNNAICNYDGGDCCFAKTNTLFCTECQCKGI